ncbi:MAG: transposase, partial [Victivallales bacterium]|nr:transposase [Victivallales bacterium]
MASSLIKIYVHGIFHVKSTSVQMDREDLPRIFEYIGGILKGIGAIPITVGGISDHIHLLSSLPSTMSIADMMRIVKAKSSKWIKSLSSAYAAFAWQDGYAAFSVS